jgi:small-conductance mechanosensitive channel
MSWLDFLNLWGSFYFESLGWTLYYFGLFLYVCIQAFLIVLYQLISFLVKTRSKKLRKFSPDLVNGIKFMIRIGITILSIAAFIAFLAIPEDTIYLIVGIATTAIVFASVKSINNFIAGVWITMSRPYSVGDYIKIKDVEGIVTEVSLNYTKIMHRSNNITQIPNLECLKSKITNYTIDIDYYHEKINRLEDLLKKHEPEEQIYKDMDNELQELLQVKEEYKKVQESLEARKKDKKLPKPSKFVRKNKLVRYTFMIALDKKPKRNSKLLDELCKKYYDRFRITPDWKIVGLRYKIDYMFVITTPNPEDIIALYDDFVMYVYNQLT